jgi:hypothetical protein
LSDQTSDEQKHPAKRTDEQKMLAKLWHKRQAHQQNRLEHDACGEQIVTKIPKMGRQKLVRIKAESTFTKGG